MGRRKILQVGTELLPIENLKHFYLNENNETESDFFNHGDRENQTNVAGSNTTFSR